MEQKGFDLISCLRNTDVPSKLQRGFQKALAIIRTHENTGVKRTVRVGSIVPACTDISFHSFAYFFLTNIDWPVEVVYGR
jgi:hypothetical protein